MRLADCEQMRNDRHGKHGSVLETTIQPVRTGRTQRYGCQRGAHEGIAGRKTDVKDAEWISDLLRHGLLKASFIPDREQRELREISRYRKSLVEERARELNRLQKMLEGANIKLDSVVKNVNGKSSRRLLDQIIAGNSLSEGEVSALLHGSMRKKLDQIIMGD